MKRFTKAILGVTLLEVMLVLAIAAMIIVMSVRYYQSASASQQANSVMEQVQSITAAADSLAQTTGSYGSAGGSGVGLSNGNLKPLLPANAFQTPWGESITVGGAQSNSYQVTIGSVPADICPLIASKLAANNHYQGVSVASSCDPSTSKDLTYTYIANP